MKNIAHWKNFFQQEHDHSFELYEGNGFVMISAPHSVSQTRNGSIKYPEPETGILANLLFEELHCPIIFKTKNCNDDANYDEASSYKDALSDYIKKNNIKFLIDLHQLSPKRETCINFGTAKFNNLDGLTCLNIFLDEFTKQNVGSIQIDIPFDASYPFTISSYTRRICGIQCLQIEINSKLVYGDNSIMSFEKVFIALKNSIERLNELFGGNK